MTDRTVCTCETNVHAARGADFAAGVSPRGDAGVIVRLRVPM
jgi:hypothetical protein